MAREKLMDRIKNGLREWLQVENTPYMIKIRETTDYELNAIRNRIWYRGDSNELQQLYNQINPEEEADRYKFWASHSSAGMEMRKIHTGIPGLMVRMLAAIVLSDMNELEFDDPKIQELWKKIDEDNHFRDNLDEALADTLVVGDGAFRISICTDISTYPIVEWVPGDCVEYDIRHGRIQEIIFKTPIHHQKKQYVLNERYGKGYIRPELTDGEKILEDMSFLPEITGIPEGGWTFDENMMLAVPFRIYKSAKYKGRGASIYDGKLDNFDALDEAWSQWMDALRAGRANTYVPENLIPRDPNTGMVLAPNPFDNRYIATGSDMSENAKNQISVQQPGIPHDSYIATYTTALDQSLQGIVSPSTLGIDVKKLDNAEAQREKEKTTLYTRNAIVEALQKTLPQVITAAIQAYDTMNQSVARQVKVNVPFGEYANPSFESQVETLAKAKQGGIMSIDAAVDELYGDTKDKAWKDVEIRRLKEEAGITEEEEPALNLDGLDIEDGDLTDGL